MYDIQPAGYLTSTCLNLLDIALISLQKIGMRSMAVRALTSVLHGRICLFTIRIEDMVEVNGIPVNFPGVPVTRADDGDGAAEENIETE